MDMELKEFIDKTQEVIDNLVNALIKNNVTIHVPGKSAEEYKFVRVLVRNPYKHMPIEGRGWLEVKVIFVDKYTNSEDYILLSYKINHLLTYNEVDNWVKFNTIEDNKVYKLPGVLRDNQIPIVGISKHILEQSIYKVMNQ